MPRKTQLKDSEYHLTKREVQKLINAAESFRDRCIIKMFAQTGIRRFELRNLDVRDLDVERRLIHIREGKGGKSRTIPCSEDLLGDLKHLLHTRKTGPVFLSNRGQALTLQMLNNIVAKAGRQAGLQNPNPKYTHINCHLFRHTFARLWKDAGGSLESLSKILGHTSIKTTLDEYGTESLETVQRNYQGTIAEMF